MFLDENPMESTTQAPDLHPLWCHPARLDMGDIGKIRKTMFDKL